jgi:glycosyltransferase involved in cell wall biosynthesis
MPMISIIVPVYKVEPYLRRCIDSILAQTFTDFECILIDDGSPDNCPTICDEYAKKDSRIIVIHQENKGVSAARNAGLDRAKGEWIGFVDSDDWIEPNMYETLLKACTTENGDIAACNYFIEKDKETIRNKRPKQLGSQQYTKMVISGKSLILQMFLATNFLLNNYRFDGNIAYGEDYLFCVKCFASAKNIIVLNDCFYHYNVTNPFSAMTQQTWVGLGEQYTATLLAEEYLKESKLYTQFKDSISYRKLDNKYQLVGYSLKLFKERDKEANKCWIRLNPFLRKFKCLFFILISRFLH